METDAHLMEELAAEGMHKMMDEDELEDEYLKKQLWKDSNYYSLPENVRNAIDIAEMKSAHSNFWYKL